ncbi:efflux RND transporter periplasmic adaptor subunit [Glaciecola sp. MH2013]|uniref:efflux RND transporter periplasmic adaptor subunit n=1 Tax=Glaciecola sp. MH2013 TaxID=2785524 RepID=UPI00189DC272|nr:efflux RND transporter periplasmic adaptor subunit [Glaciecola sp. MH2013]MBF7073477.1 efflux RND transporter periplasmic adaptor subunit [Glaciecola sp. MH2013]
MLNQKSAKESTSTVKDQSANRRNDMLGSLAMSGEQRKAKKGRVHKRTLISLSVLAALSVGFYSSDLLEISFAKEAHAEAVHVEKLERNSKLKSAAMTDFQQAPKKLEAQGFIIASRVATVSSRVMGVVEDVRIEEGDAVQLGQVLALLDDSQTDLALDLASFSLAAIEARIKTAVVDLHEKTLDLKRVSNLFDKGFVSEVAISESKNQVNRMKASLEQLNADLDVARVRVEQQESMLNDHVLRAPFDGIVVEISAQPGEVIAPSAAGGGFTRTGICTIVDMNSLQVVVDINEQLIGEIELNQEVQIQPLAYRDISLSGRVNKILPRVNIAKGTIEVHIEINENDSRILPDMGVRVAFL